MNAVPYYVANIITYMEKDGKSEYKYPKLIFKSDDII